MLMDSETRFDVEVLDRREVADGVELTVAIFVEGREAETWLTAKNFKIDGSYIGLDESLTDQAATIWPVAELKGNGES